MVTRWTTLAPSAPMTIQPRLRLRALLSLGPTAGAGPPFDVQDAHFSIIDVPTTRAGESHPTPPTAVPSQGSPIRLSTSDVGTEGCVCRDFGSSTGDSSDFLEAGDALEFSVTG